MSMIQRLALILALAAFALPATGQDAPADSEKNAEAGKEASAAPERDDSKNERVVKVKKKQPVKTLRPDEVPQELARLTSKADIKAEIKVKPHHGKPAVFKGVIRNGKLIERFEGRTFRPLKTIEKSRSGVRLWWIGGSDGWMFFRYSNIMSISITGKLTAKEKAEILRRLKAQREGRKVEKTTKPEAKPQETLEAVLQKMTRDQLRRYLLKAYPESEGWDRKKYRALKRSQIIENKALKPEETVFVRYFRDLIKARLEQLEKAPTNKTEIEPGSEKRTESDKPSGEKPSGDGVVSGDG